MSGAPPSKFAVSLAYGQRADAATAAVLRRLLDVIVGNRDGAIVGHDSEFLHRLRVAVRRSRTVQRQLASVFPPLELPGFRTEFRWLQQATGEARDLDVYLIGFEELRAMLPESLGPDLEPVRQVLTHSRLNAHAQMSRAITSRRTEELLSDWAALLESLVDLPTDDRPGATRPIGELAGERIRKAYGRVLRLGRAIDDSSPPEDYHELRKKGKELRYLLELFGAELHPAEVVDPMIGSLKALQDVLGRHQDREVQIAMLRSLADEVATLPRGPQAVMAMGMLIDRLGVDEAAARGEFADRFAAFAAKDQRHLVKATFG
jgi:CHAD domain-containing protein